MSWILSRTVHPAIVPILITSLTESESNGGSRPGNDAAMHCFCGHLKQS